jgi:hypothetical protein
VVIWLCDWRVLAGILYSGRILAHFLNLVKAFFSGAIIGETGAKMKQVPAVSDFRPRAFPNPEATPFSYLCLFFRPLRPPDHLEQNPNGNSRLVTEVQFVDVGQRLAVCRLHAIHQV